MRCHMESAATLLPMRSRYLTQAQSAQVVIGLRRRLERAHGGNVSALAREIGVSQPSLSRILRGEYGASMAVAQALADAERLAVESILASPRERAVAIAREAALDEVAIERVQHEQDDPERTTLYWIERILAFAKLASDARRTG